MRKDEDVKMMILSGKIRGLRNDIENVSKEMFDLFLQTREVLTKEQVVRKHQLTLWMKRLNSDMEEIIKSAEEVDIEEANHE